MRVFRDQKSINFYTDELSKIIYEYVLWVGTPRQLDALVGQINFTLSGRMLSSYN